MHQIQFWCWGDHSAPPDS